MSDSSVNLEGKVQVLSTFSDGFWETAERMMGFGTPFELRLDCKNVKSKQTFRIAVRLLSVSYDKKSKTREVIGSFDNGLITITYKGRKPKKGVLTT